MCHRLLGDSRFWQLLLRFDVDLAEVVRQAGCMRCDGRLDRAAYPRKPRGMLVADETGYDRRLSFCCADCRRRHTPPSVRFLGRRVYVGAVVVLATAMQQGVTPVRGGRLRELLGVSLTTLARWRAWWQVAFPRSPFWRASSGHFRTPVPAEGLPAALLERFRGGEKQRLVAMLRFLSPITSPSRSGALAN